MRIYDNGIYRDMTAEEINELTSVIETNDEPTELDKLEAQVTYTAMMTDTLLTEEI